MPSLVDQWQRPLHLPLPLSSTASPLNVDSSERPERLKKTTKKQHNGVSEKFDKIEEAVEAFARGDFIVVLDSTDRENEGDLIIAAEDLTTQKMAWMVKHTSGLIVAPMAGHLLDKLKLPQMVADNQESHCTAFTVSCDYAYDTTTGISAHDRALTCRKLADPTTTAADFRRPGHMFPLRAVDGGVRQRQGHTEAAIEFCKLAGKKQVGVICELVKEDDGLMMRRDDCLAFAKKHDLRICTIEALVGYLDGLEGTFKKE